MTCEEFRRRCDPDVFLALTPEQRFGCAEHYSLCPACSAWHRGIMAALSDAAPDADRAGIAAAQRAGSELLAADHRHMLSRN